MKIRQIAVVQAREIPGVMDYPWDYFSWGDATVIVRSDDLLGELESRESSEGLISGKHRQMFSALVELQRTNPHVYVSFP